MFLGNFTEGLMLHIKTSNQTVGTIISISYGYSNVDADVSVRHHALSHG